MGECARPCNLNISALRTRSACSIRFLDPPPALQSRTVRGSAVSKYPIAAQEGNRSAPLAPVMADGFNRRVKKAATDQKPYEYKRVPRYARSSGPESAKTLAVSCFLILSSAPDVAICLSFGSESLRVTTRPGSFASGNKRRGQLPISSYRLSPKFGDAAEC